MNPSMITRSNRGWYDYFWGTIWGSLLNYIKSMLLSFQISRLLYYGYKQILYKYKSWVQCEKTLKKKRYSQASFELSITGTYFNRRRTDLADMLLKSKVSSERLPLNKT